jgi:predicted MPP superfamily phosphohydrolase
MKAMWMIIFLLLPLFGIGYLSWHIWCLMPCAWWWKLLAVVLLASPFFTMIFGMRGLYDSMPLPIGTALYEICTSSVFVMMYLVILFLLLDLGRLLHLVSRTLLYNNWWTLLGITIVMVGIFVYGNLHYQHKYRQELTLTTDKHIERPMKLVMISDLHIGYHNPRKELHRWIDMINDEKPDLVLIAGDIIDMSMRPLKEERMAEEFHRLTAPVYACLGNHEYYSGQPGALQFYRDAGINLLRDSAVVVGDLCIIGRDDRANLHRKSLGAIMKSFNVQRSTFNVLLDHQPYHLEQAERHHVDFQFSGHTHHGQVWPISWITESIYECAHGAHQRGNTRYYISSGLGIWGGKFRIGTRSEYIVATIKTK